MSDLISREATLNALGERPMVWTSDDDYSLGERNQYDIDRLAIETVPSAQPNWISAKEMLPEVNGRYLVTRGLMAAGALWNRVYIVNYSDLMGIKSEKIWWQGNVGKSDFERLDDVVSWMPLPEPWKGERNEL